MRTSIIIVLLGLMVCRAAAVCVTFPSLSVVAGMSADPNQLKYDHGVFGFSSPQNLVEVNDAIFELRVNPEGPDTITFTLSQQQACCASYSITAANVGGSVAPSNC